MAPRRIVVLSVLMAYAACSGTRSGGARVRYPALAEIRALDGRLLVPAALPARVAADREQKLEQALVQLEADQEDRDAWIWVGRRLGYLGRYLDAIDVFTRALERWPNDPFLLRHRGHRHLTVREFDRATEDLSRAALACREVQDIVEPDGLPVPGRPPHSSLHFNVYYHLGLACFFEGDMGSARDAWLLCLACSDNDESRVAVTHWLWCARARCGDRAGALEAVQAITADMDVVENTAYHQLCLLYKGERTRDQLTAGAGSSGAALRFGLAHHALVAGDRAGGEAALRALAADPGWAAFGVIAAEAELARGFLP